MVLKRKRGTEWVEANAQTKIRSPPVSVAEGQLPVYPPQIHGKDTIRRPPITGVLGQVSTPAKKVRATSKETLAGPDSVGPSRARRTYIPPPDAQMVPPVASSASARYEYSMTSSQGSSASRPPQRHIPSSSQTPRPPHKSAAASTPSYPQGSTSALAPPRKDGARQTQGKGGETPPEKRLAKFKPRCPQNILDRLERVSMQTFYMLDRHRNETEFKEIFKVSGSTGNVYTVEIGQVPSCSCPDGMKGNHCKHILFVLIKVLQVSRASGMWYQKALLTSELQTIFTEAPAAPNAVTNPRMQAVYDQAVGRVPAAASSTATVTKKKIPQEDDDCPVCYDSMFGAAETLLVFCEACGNGVHGGCFARWSTTAKSQGKNVTCVWCRSKWVELGSTTGSCGREGGGTAVRRISTGGYLNLAGASGLSPVRDTSTYYHGPVRGQRYYGNGSRRYEDD